jgi:hypothetical protein
MDRYPQQQGPRRFRPSAAEIDRMKWRTTNE